MTDPQLKLVARMRDLQRQYFEARQKQMHSTATSLLHQCKDAERAVDRMIREAEEPDTQCKLFQP